MPTDDEVEDYEFRLRIEAEENGEDLDDESDGDGDDDEDQVDENLNAPVQNAVANVVDDATACKICYDRRAKVLTLPCRHAVMCEECAIQIVDNRCPVCRTDIVQRIVMFF